MALFVVAVLVAIGACWPETPHNGNNQSDPQPTNVVAFSCCTNQVEDRAKPPIPNVQWFTVGSKYIWDDWKLK